MPHDTMIDLVPWHLSDEPTRPPPEPRPRDPFFEQPTLPPPSPAPRDPFFDAPTSPPPDPAPRDPFFEAETVPVLPCAPVPDTDRIRVTHRRFFVLAAVIGGSLGLMVGRVLAEPLRAMLL